MIQIAKIAFKVKDFLEIKEVEKFKIFIRINFNIDVYIFTSNVDIAHEYYNEFINSLSDNSESGNFDDFYAKHGKNLNLKFNVISIDDALDPFYTNVLSGEENNIDWGPRYRFDSLLKEKEPLLNKGTQYGGVPIVTFYSYKGGMGRTTAMVAYAIDLAVNNKKKVVMVDCDLEAPGYLNFFDLSNHKGLKSGKKNGLVEFMSDAQFIKNSEQIELNDYIINVGSDDNNRTAYNNLANIWLVPAGNLNETYSDSEVVNNQYYYLEGLSRINLSNVNSVVSYFRLLFRKIEESIHPDVILLDSRTGFNDIFGTAAFFLSSCVVGFFGFSRQTQPGLLNLLNEYYKKSSSFKLNIVFSILPIDTDSIWASERKQEILAHINLIGNETKDFPKFIDLHRNSQLEKIGTGDERSDLDFVDLVKSKQFSDYDTLFSSINSVFPKEKITNRYSKNTRSLELRNVILRHLKDALKNVRNFAEDTEIKEEQFFYRDCMTKLFNPEKFLIQGYKGTGKTYLYKALGDESISEKIQKMAVEEGIGCESSSLKPKFFTVLSTGKEKDEVNKTFPFNSIQYEKIEEPEYYFNAFWQIHTWNSLLLDELFKDIREQSQLKNYVLPMGNNETVKRFNELIDAGIDTLISIEKDLQNINNLLQNKGIMLFVLYDRLDTCINPLRWNKAVSPLINYWWENRTKYSNIIPKIFVRTDLFRQIEGTNTARLTENIINIEWSIGEVFGYFFKLIFSNENASEAYWAITEKIGINHQTISLIKDQFTRNNKQFKSTSLTQANMSPLIQVFFGRSVKVGNANLGSPWEYFSNNLANADRSAISLRPFINTLDGNAVDEALGNTVNHVQEIISAEIYASRKVRVDTAEKYFNDLTQDEFSKDLLALKNFILSEEGVSYRYKSLSEKQFDEMITIIFSNIEGNSKVVKNVSDLKTLIYSNGIIAEKITTGGRFYRFAPIYWYAWGLSNSVFENEERRKPRYQRFAYINKKAKRAPDNPTNR